MKILVTGAAGFIGKNLCLALKNKGHTVFSFDTTNTQKELDKFCKEAEFIFHLAGVNRPLHETEYNTGNFGFTSTLLDSLKKAKNKAPIMISSSTQATLDNPYGKSKLAGEDLIFKYGEEAGVKVYVYRFTNVFGKWSRPNYNSVVATFAHNIARGLPIRVNDPHAELDLVYIDDVVQELLNAINGNVTKTGSFCAVNPHYLVTVGEIATLLTSFKESRKNLFVPDVGNDFVRKLYATYLSFLPENDFEYDLVMHQDERGSFSEILKSKAHGQVSVNVIKPGITKGHHYHHTRNEKFLVVSGKGIICFRHILGDDVIEYEVSEDKHRVIDIPVGYVHTIKNVGTKDLVVFMWSSTVYDKDNDDTEGEEL